MKAYQQLASVFQRLSHLNHLAAIASWDEAVMMPTGGSEARARSLATLSSIAHEILTNPKNGDLLQEAKSGSLDSEWELANLKWMERQYKNATCLPATLVRQKTEAAIRSEQAWRAMRSNNDWKGYMPYLETILSLVKESAQIRSAVFDKPAYDVLIDDFSPGMSQAIIDPIFTELKAFLPDFLRTVLERQQSDLLKPIVGHFDIEKQKALGLELMQAIGFDFNNGRLDVSHHPFCGGVAEDVRITTRYRENEFISSLMGICHETGHAMYELGLPKKWLEQPVGQALGMSLHESQSLLVEMQACRSTAFIEFLLPLLKKYFADNAAFTLENMQKIYTQVKPGLIRVDADEVSYPLHIIMRYEIEKKLIEGDLSIKDLPEVWHDTMSRFFGLSTKGNDMDGVMQDVHWPSGAVGYFPAYTLGAMIAAQLFATASAKHPEIEAELTTGNFTTLMTWLRKHVHSKGSLLQWDDLLREATASPLQSKFFIEHLQKRYL